MQVSSLLIKFLEAAAASSERAGAEAEAGGDDGGRGLRSRPSAVTWACCSDLIAGEEGRELIGAE